MQPEIKRSNSLIKIQKVLLITQMSHRNVSATSLLRFLIETMRGGKRAAWIWI